MSEEAFFVQESYSFRLDAPNQIVELEGFPISRHYNIIKAINKVFLLRESMYPLAEGRGLTAISNSHKS